MSPIAQSSARRILDGTPGLINAALGLKVGFETKTAALQLSKSPIPLNAALLLSTLYERIMANWDRSTCRSTQLWRSSPKSDIAAHNDSPEKTLEKAIVQSVPGWFNQIPTASGLLRGVEEKHRNVDLGHFTAPGHLELIELKAGAHADTPLKAAFELVGYGLLYCFARKQRSRLALTEGSRVLNANRVDLKVLAPREVYGAYHLKWLETSLDAGFQQFSNELLGTPMMSFRFESFPKDFQWPGTHPHELANFLERRTSVDW